MSAAGIQVSQGKSPNKCLCLIFKITLKKTKGPTSITDLCAKNFLAVAQVRGFSLSSRAEIYHVKVALLTT